MVEAPVAKGLLASGGGTLLGAALIGGVAYYLFKHYGKKSDEQAVEGEVVEQSQKEAVVRATAEATPA